MLDKPDLTDASLIACLRDHYPQDVTTLEFLPLGNAPDSWTYRVETADGERCFLKVKRGDVDPAAVLVPRTLHDSGLNFVVAPWLTQSGDLWATLGDYHLMLSPYIEGNTGLDRDLSDSQWIEYGAALRQIHASQSSADLLHYLESETFEPQWNASLFDRIEYATSEDMVTRALAAFWGERSVEIRQIVARCESLGQMFQQRSPALVLCHTDYHRANILLDAQGQIHVVDWDTPLLAPKERDLMFIAGDGAAQERYIQLFFEGYGPAEIDAVGIAYYRYEWVVQEFNDYAARIILSPDLSDNSRQDALRQFQQLFDPGDVVDLAYQSDDACFTGSGGTAT